MRYAGIKEIDATTLSGADPLAELLAANQPFVIRNMVGHWPLIEHGRSSPAALRTYLKAHALDRQFAVMLAPPNERGRPFYDQNMKVNFVERRMPFDEICDGFAEFEDAAEPPLMYCGSIELAKYFDTIAAQHTLPLGARKPRIGLWLGLKSDIPIHSDYTDNLVCNVLGRRRVTLFAPDQLKNLYIGPLDNTPAGRAVSLVDFNAPDYKAHPLFAEAEKTACSVELSPGDMLHIPTMWWHTIQSLDGFNAMVNFWWRDSNLPANPDAALVNAISAWRDLPDDEKQIWRAQLDHYVFGDVEKSIAHIPEAGRGVLGPASAQTAEKMRLFILRLLNE